MYQTRIRTCDASLLVDEQVLLTMYIDKIFNPCLVCVTKLPSPEKFKKIVFLV